MEAGKHEITVSVAISGQNGSTQLRIEERIQSEGTLPELTGIFHQVHELAEKIRDEQAGLKA